MKDGADVIKLIDKKSNGAHCVSLFVDRNTVLYFDSFGIEYIPQDVLGKIKDKSVTHNIFRTQDDDCIMCGFYRIAFKEYMIGDKT